MSLSLIETCKKRRRNPKTFGFYSFGDPGSPITPSGPFHENVRFFLQECGELMEYTVLGNPLWCTLLIDNKANFMAPLYTLEKDVYQSSHPFCDYCRSFGWSRHFVTKRTYHFIIPMDSGWQKPLDDSALDNQSHLLHGVIHCNGCGHLVCINGCEGGSKDLRGREIMDLWDRICSNLKARRVSVEDVSRKRSMDLRLLHGVAYDHSWFGRWYYRFCQGSFGVTQITYSGAIAYLGSLEINDIATDLSKTKCNKEVKQIIRCYRDMSETQITTIRDLLRFMLTVRPRAPVTRTNYVTSTEFNSRNPTRQTPSKRTTIMKDKSLRYEKFNTKVANMDSSRWTRCKLEFAAEVIVDALNDEHKAKGVNVLTRQDVRDAARLHIADAGLLDYVLESLNDVIVGNYVVRRMENPRTRTLEYIIHEHGNELEMEPEVMAHLDPKEESSRMPGNDVNSDVLYVYKNVLLGYPDSENVELAVKTILDGRHFVKDFRLIDKMEQPVLTFICKLKPTDAEIKYEMSEPGHDVIVVVPLYATVGELKKAAEAALRDTYCIAERVTVIEFAELKGVSDEEVLLGRIKPGEELCVRGIDIDLDTLFKYQGEQHNLKVRCKCGAQDDNGERMVACNICKVWQHKRCNGIEDSETVSRLFRCGGCWKSYAPKS